MGGGAAAGRARRAVNLWNAAALGLTDRLDAACESAEPPRADELTNAFWCACHGGQRAAAEYLLDRGADRDWVGYDDLDAARRSAAQRRGRARRLAGRAGRAERRGRGER